MRSLTWLRTWNCTTSSMLETDHTLTLPSSLQVAKCFSSGLNTTAFTWTAEKRTPSTKRELSLTIQSIPLIAHNYITHWHQMSLGNTYVKMSIEMVNSTIVHVSTLFLWPLTSRMLLLSDQLMYQIVPAVVPTMPMSRLLSNAALTVAPSSIISCSGTTLVLLKEKGGWTMHHW